MDPEHYCPSTGRTAKVHCWSSEGGMVKLLVIPKTENTFYLWHHQLLMSMAFSQYSKKKKKDMVVLLYCISFAATSIVARLIVFPWLMVCCILHIIDILNDITHI